MTSRLGGSPFVLSETHDTHRHTTHAAEDVIKKSDVPPGPLRFDKDATDLDTAMI